ncbi:CidA/LrgA family protein [Alicycliphilus denitrificans]|uniref:LrgA family protein n=2 Tax=Alicycliphilus denitrificans TaxID=179636 RepID=F4GBC5_ALIDK|nr:CidA/LrgA family protein [Alicycliphilus denitrificans]AEB84701.1 LrgA family protein [Alicycliphilus denitrificans K601]
MSRTELRIGAMASRTLQFSLGFVVLAALLSAGGRLVRWLHLPIPPAIVGMVLLLAVLACFGRLVAAVEAASTPLLKHMMLFFIPTVAGVMEQFQTLRTGWLPFVVACVAGAALTLAVTALTLQKLLKRQGAAG